MITLTQEDVIGMNAINARIPGWSDGKQYAFFKFILAELPWLKDLLIVGVYQGRDIAYILDIAGRYHKERTLRITGVDKFEDTPCEDWPKEKRQLNWRAAGFGEAPSLTRAAENLGWRETTADRLKLIRGCDDLFLREIADTDQRFDFVYLDTSHDYETVARQLRQVWRVTREPAIVAGDDYSDAGTWGVKRAVSERLVHHSVFANWIWFADRKDLKPDLSPCSPSCNSSKT